MFSIAPSTSLICDVIMHLGDFLSHLNSTEDRVLVWALYIKMSCNWNPELGGNYITIVLIEWEIFGQPFRMNYVASIMLVMSDR